MKKWNSILIFTFLALLFGACTEENDLRTVQPDAEIVPAHINLSALPMENAGNLDLGKMDGTLTRADKKLTDPDASMDVSIGGAEPVTRMTDAEEKALKDACVFQFDASSKKYLYSQYVSNAVVGGNDISLAVNDGASDICVIANMGDLTTDLSSKLTAGLSITDFKALVIKTLTATSFASELPMWGWKENINVSTSSDVSVTLKFMVAKVAFKATVASGVSLNNIKVTLKNVASQLAIDPLTGVPAADKVIDYATVNVANTTDLANGKDLTWYIPENKQAEVSSCTNATLRGGDLMPKTGTYIEVSGTSGTADLIYQIYLGNGTSTKDFTVARGYRYNVTAAIKGFNVNDARVLIGKDLSAAGTKTANCYMVPLAANTWYRFKGTVRGNGRGVTTGVAADTFTPDNTLGTAGNPETTKMPGWAINANNLGSGDIGNLAPDKAFVLWQTATAEGTGTGTALTSAAWSNSGYIVFCTNGSTTEGNAVIAATKSGEIVWSWHIWKTAYTPASLDPKAAASQIFKVRNNTVASNAWVTNGAFKERTEKVMTRNLGAEHNSPATVKNDGKSGGLLYQWGRKDPFIGSKNFTAADDATKNTPYPTIYATGYKWKDGSTSVHEAATTAGAVGKGAVLNSIKNPMSFYTQQSDKTYDWVAASRVDQNDNLWGNPNSDPAPNQGQLPNRSRGAKSVYDPCPYGWRVAPQDTWTAFTKTAGAKYGGNNYGSGDCANWNVVGNESGTADYATVLKKKFEDDKGWTFYYDSDGANVSNTVYFPASGYRHGVGKLGNVGVASYLWSVSSLGKVLYSGAVFTCFVEMVNVIANGNRYVGRPVRCVQE